MQRLQIEHLSNLAAFCKQSAGSFKATHCLFFSESIYGAEIQAHKALALGVHALLMIEFDGGTG